MWTRIIALAASLALAACATTHDRVRIASGEIEGTGRQASGVRIFRGIPYAAPPIGALRWRAPEPVAPWDGVRDARNFGPRCMQPSIFADMVFRSPGVSEDCLTINVWTPARSDGERLPVLVYFYGGGYVAGAGDEPRYDGESLAARGIVVVTMNYRLGVFGFFTHPELSAEAAYGGSGNQALLDHAAALTWVRDNIEAFGGDPARVTVAGESAGSASASAVMASPLTRELIAGAIGESGSIIGGAPSPLAAAEQAGAAFGAALGAPTLEALRALPAQDLLNAAMQRQFGVRMVLDNHVFPRPPREIFEAGEQARVPLLVGSNSAEGGPDGVLGPSEPTLANYRAALTRLYGSHAEAVFNAYPASGDGEPVRAAAQELANDRFIGASTWTWIDLATRTGAQPSYYYYFTHPRPPLREGVASPYGPDWRPPIGAAHSAEIEYALGNLETNTLYAWTDEDRRVSDEMQRYFVNFVKTGDPNGAGLPRWETYSGGQRLILNAHSRSVPDTSRARYESMSRLPR